MFAEEMVCKDLAGHPNFVFLQGCIKRNKLVLDLIGNDVRSDSVNDVVKNNIDLGNWQLRHVKA